MNVNRVDHVAVEHISDRDAPFHSALEATDPRVEWSVLALPPARMPAEPLQWNSLAFDHGLPKHSA